MGNGKKPPVCKKGSSLVVVLMCLWGYLERFEQLPDR